MLKVSLLHGRQAVECAACLKNSRKKNIAKPLLVLTNQFSDNHNVVGGRRGCDRHVCHVDKRPMMDIGNEYQFECEAIVTRCDG